MANQYRRLPNLGGTQREVAEVVNNLVEGKINSTGTLTLDTGGATTTTLIDRRIGPDSVILFTPLSVAAAAANFYPYGTFEERSDITFAVANTPYVLNLSNTEYAYGMSLASNRITVDYGGIYDLDISALFVNQEPQIYNGFLWVRVNGTDYPYSATKFAITEHHGSTDGYVPVAVNHPLELEADDYVEVVAAVGHNNVYLESYTALTLEADDYVEVVAAVGHNNVYLESYTALTTPFVMPGIPSLMVNLMMVDPSGLSDSAFEMYVTDRQNGQATVNHLPNSLANKTFAYVILG